MLELPLRGVAEQLRRSGLRRVESGPESGVGKPAVGLLEALGRVLLGAERLGGVRQQHGTALEQPGVLGH